MRKLALKSLKRALIIMLGFFMVTAFSMNAAAKSKIVRFNVGFSADEALENLQAGSNWSYNEMGCVFWPLIYDPLWILGPAPDYNPLPRLATRWETEDHKTWRFYLNKNARFHDGKPLTAEDVAFTLWYLPKSDPSWDYPDTDVEDKKSINIIDDYTIEFTLANKSYGKYPPVYSMPILPKHIWLPHKKRLANFKNEKAIGSGPFKLKKFKSGEFIWMVKNEDYWGGKPSVDEVVFKSFGGNDALGLALKRGDIDMLGYNGISPLSIPSYKRTKNVEIKVSPGIGLVWLTFNLHKKGPVVDKSFRQAIMYGINRQKIIDMAYLGYAQASNSFIYPELPEYNKDLPWYDYNPDLAKTMLENAGYKDTDGDGIRNDPATKENITLEFMIPSDWTDEVKAARIIKEQLLSIGLNISMKVLDLDTFNEFIYAPKDDKFDMSIFVEEPGPNGNWIWEFVRSFDNGGEGWNQAYYSNAEFDTLLNSYIAESDLEKRKEKLFQMQTIMAEDLPYANLVRPNMICPYRTDRLEGFVATMGGFSTWINPWTYFKVRPKQK